MRTYTCHGYVLYDLLRGSVRQEIKSGVGRRCGWRGRESLIFLLQQLPGLSYLQYCGLHAIFTDFTDMLTAEALATSAIATSTLKDTGLFDRRNYAVIICHSRHQCPCSLHCSPEMIPPQRQVQNVLLDYRYGSGLELVI
jgi:hypothetical protein